MVVVGIGAFVGFRGLVEVVVIGGDLRGELGFFESIVDNLMGVADPTAG